MDYGKLQDALVSYPVDRVSLYISYLKKLESEKTRAKPPEIKNKWFNYFTVAQAEEAFMKVATTGIWLDGEMVTLSWRGQIVITYDYSAYKNRVLHIYPESIFDCQTVHEGDTFTSRKESGKVYYEHEIAEPFATGKKLIGAYCVVKNKRGEFIETINLDDINKMKSVAKTQAIWNVWFGEMVMKSVSKRACKRHFKDIVSEMDKLDNEENYNTDTAGLPVQLCEKIEAVEGAGAFKILGKIYNDFKGKVDQAALIAKLTDHKELLRKSLPQMTEADFPAALEMLSKGKSAKDLLLVWQISEEVGNQFDEIKNLEEV